MRREDAAAQSVVRRNAILMMQLALRVKRPRPELESCGIEQVETGTIRLKGRGRLLPDPPDEFIQIAATADGIAESQNKIEPVSRAVLRRERSHLPR